jgi:mono/diheme cytochrome c family protein
MATNNEGPKKSPRIGEPSGGVDDARRHVAQLRGTSLARKLMLATLGTAVVGLGYVAWLSWSGRAPRPQRVVQIPEFSAQGKAGQLTFEAYCMACHGEHAMGGPNGPPLVDPIYRPSHHADIAFALAVRRGVRAHHSRFGDMPPQPSIGEEDVRNITRYIRELQRANGIE